MSFGGLRPLDPHQGRCPWTPPGALKRAPGPHAVMGERSARFARYASQLFPFFSQQPSGISDYNMHILFFKNIDNFEIEHKYANFGVRGVVPP